MSEIILLIAALAGILCLRFLFGGFDRFIGGSRKSHRVDTLRELEREARVVHREMGRREAESERLRTSLSRMASKNPDRIAGVMQHWLHEDGPHDIFSPDKGNAPYSPN